MDYPSWLQSSTGPAVLAMRWKSVLVAFVPAVLAILSVFGVPIAETELMDILEAVLWIFALCLQVAGWIRAKFPGLTGWK